MEILIIPIIVSYPIALLWCRQELNLFYNGLKTVKAGLGSLLVCFIPFVNILVPFILMFENGRFNNLSFVNKFFKSNKYK